mgnify:CR=1 FL=1
MSNSEIKEKIYLGERGNGFESILFNENLLKIITILMKYDEINITKLKKMTNFAHSKLQVCIETLIELEIATQVPCCIKNMKIYRINWNETTRFIQLILDELASFEPLFIKDEFISISILMMILHMLCITQELSITQIVRVVKRRHATVLRIMETLAQKNIIEYAKPYISRTKIFRLNKESKLGQFAKRIFTY